MTRKLTEEEVKLWQKAVRDNFREQSILFSEKKTPAPKPRSAQTIDARLDLHGHTIERAHMEFVEFVFAASMDGYKKLLVITGKGNPGKIRTEFPKWCGVDYLRPFIASCAEAAPIHGGAGAFYVNLRN